MPRPDGDIYNSYALRGADHELRMDTEGLARRKLNGDALRQALAFIWGRQRMASQLEQLKKRLEFRDDLPDDQRVPPLVGRSIFTPDQVANLLADRVSGMTYEELAKKYKCSSSTTWHYCNPEETDD